MEGELEEDSDSLDKNQMMGKWEEWGIPAKWTEHINILGREEIDLFSELIGDDSSQVNKGECKIRQCWRNRQEPDHIGFML